MTNKSCNKSSPSIVPYNNDDIIRGSDDKKIEMKIIISSILCAIMVSADSMGKYTVRKLSRISQGDEMHKILGIRFPS